MSCLFLHYHFHSAAQPTFNICYQSNSKRWESWTLLHTKLSEWIQRLCDELGDLIIPCALPPAVHCIILEKSLKGVLGGRNAINVAFVDDDTRDLFSTFSFPSSSLLLPAHHPLLLLPPLSQSLMSLVCQPLPRQQLIILLPLFTALLNPLPLHLLLILI